MTRTAPSSYCCAKTRQPAPVRGRCTPKAARCNVDSFPGRGGSAPAWAETPVQGTVLDCGVAIRLRTVSGSYGASLLFHGRPRTKWTRCDRGASALADQQEVESRADIARSRGFPRDRCAADAEVRARRLGWQGDGEREYRLTEPTRTIRCMGLPDRSAPAPLRLEITWPCPRHLAGSAFSTIKCYRGGDRVRSRCWPSGASRLPGLEEVQQQHVTLGLVDLRRGVIDGCVPSPSGFGLMNPTKWRLIPVEGDASERTTKRPEKTSGQAARQAEARGCLSYPRAETGSPARTFLWTST